MRIASRRLYTPPSMMSKLPVNDEGIELSYIDSGPPEQTVYRTVFAIHGFGWGAGMFPA